MKYFQINILIFIKMVKLETKKTLSKILNLDKVRMLKYIFEIIAPKIR